MQRCRNCQSDRLLEDDDGQIVCDACGTIAQAVKQITAMQEMDEAVGGISMRNIRVGLRPGTSKKARTAEEIALAELELERVKLQRIAELRELLPMLVQKFKQDIGVLYLDEEAVNKEAEDIILQTTSHTRAQRLIALLFHYSFDPFLLASDVINFGTSGVLPIMGNGLCLEFGPHLIYIQSQRERAVNWKAVALRFSLKIATVLKMDWFELWRAVYWVLFVLRGWESLESPHGFGLPSAVIACVVLVPGWHAKVQSQLDKSRSSSAEVRAFRFTPLNGGLSRPTTTLLDAMEHDVDERRAHFHRQNLALDGLSTTTPNHFLRSVFEKRTTTTTTTPSPPPRCCDGKCLERLAPIRDNDDGARPGLILAERGLDVWRHVQWHSEAQQASDVNRALVCLIDLVSTALDHGVGLFPPASASSVEAQLVQGKVFAPRPAATAVTSKDRLFIRNEIRNVVRMVQSPPQPPAEEDEEEEQLTLADFVGDTEELLAMGCQTILLCPRQREQMQAQRLLYADTVEDDDEDNVQ